MIDPAEAEEFLSHHRIAVVGASADQRQFGNTIFRELRKHGYDAIPVNPQEGRVEGQPCYPTVTSVPGHIDGVIVMVHKDKAPEIVRECVACDVPRVWLFKGIGGAGAASEEAVEMCRDAGIDVVAGACPLMFLEPVKGFHKFHRTLRRLNGSIAKVA